MIKHTVKESIFMQTAQHTPETLNLTFNMVKASNGGATAPTLMDNTTKAKNTVKEATPGLMAQIIPANGSKIASMA